MGKVEQRYFYGLDSIRFICALIVVMGHFEFAFPKIPFLPQKTGLIWDNLFNGPAAVIVFFVVSGFVIHLPQASRGDDSVKNIPSYYARRFVRIAIPSFVALFLFYYVGSNVPGVLWSVICEGIYYALYPLLLLIARRFTWAAMICATGLFALILALANPEALALANNNYGAFGNYFNWVIGLPVWLAGCWLAENYGRFPQVSKGQIYMARIGIFLLSAILRVVKFHVTAPWGSNVIWLNLFGIVAVVWIGLEIAYNRKGAESRRLEWLGTWSFSLYLMHPVISAYVEHWHIARTFTHMFAIVPIVLIASYAFYLCIERPSHKLARSAGNRFSARVKTVS